jgi:hypothetical protein
VIGLKTRGFGLDGDENANYDENKNKRMIRSECQLFTWDSGESKAR